MHAKSNPAHAEPLRTRSLCARSRKADFLAAVIPVSFANKSLSFSEDVSRGGLMSKVKTCTVGLEVLAGGMNRIDV